VILATGVVDVLPDIDGCEQAIARGVIRLCPICDAYETLGKRVAVYGAADDAKRHARYLRTFSGDVTALGIAEVQGLEIHERGVRAMTADGSADYDVLYPVLGTRPNSQLARRLGAKCDDRGYIVTDAHQRTTVPGLYAIGDVAQDVDQIAVATGHAAIAATAIHNELPQRWMLR
jgi:thioredoxin reductase (NADPH)